MNALILGGGDTVWDDLRAVGPWDGLIIAVNDVGCVYPHRFDHWVSLHPEKFPMWGRDRERRGLDMSFQLWGEGRSFEYLTLDPPGWNGGSSGLYAVGVALERLDCEAVVLCGVPMENRPHFFHAEEWAIADAYRARWTRNEEKMRGRVFSMSGWTCRFLGAPPANLIREAA